jgi:hypothetical protein
MRVLIVYDSAGTEALSIDLWALARSDHGRAEQIALEHTSDQLNKATGIANFFKERIAHQEPKIQTNATSSVFATGSRPARGESSYRVGLCEGMSQNALSRAKFGERLVAAEVDEATTSSAETAQRTNFVFDPQPIAPRAVAGRVGYEFYVYTRIGAIRDDELEDGILAVAMAISTIRIDAVLIYTEASHQPDPFTILGAYAAYPNILRDVAIFTMNRAPNGQIALLGFVEDTPGSDPDLCSAQRLLARSARADSGALIPGATLVRTLCSDRPSQVPFMQSVTSIEPDLVAAWTPAVTKPQEGPPLDNSQVTANSKAGFHEIWASAPFELMETPGIWDWGSDGRVGPPDELLERKLRVAAARSKLGPARHLASARAIIGTAVESARAARYADDYDPIVAQDALVDLCRVTHALAAHHFSGPIGSAMYAKGEKWASACGLYHGGHRDPFWGVQMHLHARALLEAGKARHEYPTPYNAKADYFGAVLGALPSYDSVVEAIRHDYAVGLQKLGFSAQLFDKYLTRDLVIAISAIRAGTMEEYPSLMQEACGESLRDMDWPLNYRAGFLVFPMILIRHLDRAISRNQRARTLPYHLMILSLTGPLTESDLRGPIAAARSYIYETGTRRPDIANPMDLHYIGTSPIFGRGRHSRKLDGSPNEPGHDQSLVSSGPGDESSIMEEGLLTPPSRPLQTPALSCTQGQPSPRGILSTARDEIGRAEWDASRLPHYEALQDSPPAPRMCSRPSGSGVQSAGVDWEQSTVEYQVAGPARTSAPTSDAPAARRPGSITSTPPNTGTAISWDTVGAVARGAASPAGSVGTSVATPVHSGTFSTSPPSHSVNPPTPAGPRGGHLRPGAWGTIADTNWQDSTPYPAPVVEAGKRQPAPQLGASTWYAGLGQRSANEASAGRPKGGADLWREAAPRVDDGDGAAVAYPEPAGRSTERMAGAPKGYPQPSAETWTPWLADRLNPIASVKPAWDNSWSANRPNPSETAKPTDNTWSMANTHFEETKICDLTLEEALDLSGPVIRKKWDEVGTAIYKRFSDMRNPGSAADRQIEIIATAYGIPEGVIMAAYKAFIA